MSGPIRHPSLKRRAPERDLPTPRPRATAELIDAHFDGELDAREERELFALLGQDAERAEEFARTHRIVAELERDPERVSAPDLSEAILDRVHAKRRFLSGRTRAAVKRTRYAMAAAGLLVAACVGVTYRMNPDLLRLTPAERPVTRVLEAGPKEASANMDRLAAGIEEAYEPLARIARDVASAGSVERREGNRPVVLVAGPLDGSPGASTPSLKWDLGRVGAALLGGSGGVTCAETPRETLAAGSDARETIVLWAMDAAALPAHDEVSRHCWATVERMFVESTPTSVVFDMPR